MMPRVFLLLFLLVVLLVWHPPVFSQTTGFHGQLSGWITGSEDQGPVSQTGFRYIPELFVEHPFTNALTFDVELSADIYGAFSVHDAKSNETDSDVKAYRVWGRLAGDQFEVRTGLQKLNFGSATLFRPLRWFDRIDPRDPLKLTKGVYGLLSRIYFQNNVNIWLWGLYGNNDVKGQEIAPTKKNRPEFGGRLQAPVYTGELGVTFHHRQADFTRLSSALGTVSRDSSVDESRLGLDGKWDIGVGAWFEGAVTRYQTETSHLKYQQALTLGMDYTFGIGNGLNTVGEYYIAGTGSRLFDKGDSSEFLGLSVNYPTGLTDTVSAIVYYDTDKKDWYRTLTWQRLFNDWSVYLIGFWNPGSSFVDGSAGFSGKGFRLLVVFNH